MIGGALASTLLPHWFFGVSILWNPSALLLGAAFGFLGWFLSENLGDSVVVLIQTVFPGLVVLSYLNNEMWRTLAIAFICGFNTGKLIGGIRRDFT